MFVGRLCQLQKADMNIRHLTKLPLILFNTEPESSEGIHHLVVDTSTMMMKDSSQLNLLFFVVFYSERPLKSMTYMHGILLKGPFQSIFEKKQVFMNNLCSGIAL